jgi:hypothetical protein
MWARVRPTLYSFILFDVPSSCVMFLEPDVVGAADVVATCIPITSLFNLACFCSGVSCHEESPPLSPAREGAFAPLPVLNLRFFSFVGSTREDQSPFEGAVVIHSSRFNGAADAAGAGIWAPIDDCIEDSAAVSLAGGRLGP